MITITKNRQTRTHIELGPSVAFGFDESDKTWATYCIEHEALQIHETRTGARKCVATPASWCDRCADQVD